MKLSFARENAYIYEELRICEIIYKLISYNIYALLAILVLLMQSIFVRSIWTLNELRIDSICWKKRFIIIKSMIRLNCRELSHVTLYSFIFSLYLNNLSAFEWDILAWLLRWKNMSLIMISIISISMLKIKDVWIDWNFANKIFSYAI